MYTQQAKHHGTFAAMKSITGLDAGFLTRDGTGMSAGRQVQGRCTYAPPGF